MASSSREIFGISITSAYVRAGKINLGGRRKAICQTLAMAFGLGEETGTSLYTTFRNRQNIDNTLGLDETSYYHLYEGEIYDIFNGAYPSETEANKRSLALVTNAIIFGYYLNPGATTREVYLIVGQALLNTASRVNEHQIFTTTTQGEIVHPISETVIKSLLQKNYSLVLKAVATSPKEEEVNIVNYNWYDTRSIFTSPNPQLSKDIENQYYYLSGKLFYESDNVVLPDCVEDNIVINTVSGIITTKFIRNVPCVDKNSYIGPVTGVKFNRIFNDGPYSTGDFTKDIRNAYINFDRTVLESGDYLSNNEVIYSFYPDGSSGFVPVYNGGVFINANGPYSVSGEEYKYAPDTSDCVGHYQSMHVGNNKPRVICSRDSFNACLSCETGFTGYKFANIQLEDHWLSKFSYIQANPALDTGHILKRALNIEDNPYVATRVGDEYQTYVMNFPVEDWYFGPPQLHGGNSLPTLAFFQDFDSVTFDKNASVSIYPALGIGGGVGSEASRSYSVSPINIFSGQLGGHTSLEPTGGLVKFVVKVSSASALDDISKQFFGMGDNFSGQFQVISESRENAGYFYTGYILSGDGQSYDALEFLDNYSGYILGSPINQVKFISGYEANGKQYPMSRMYGQTKSGDLVKYYYLNKQNIPSEFAVKETGLASFGELPAELESNGTRLYATQKVENFLPRYSNGPFSVESRKFIYPHAKEATETYPAKTFGFPNRIRYSLNVREEVVKELYVEYFINRDGLVDTTPNYIRVVRPTSSGGYNSSSTFPIMKEAFEPIDSRYDYEMDFNNNKVSDYFSYSYGLNAVDNNWAPTDPILKVPSGRNSVVYDGLQTAESVYYQGLRYTGSSSPSEHRIFTGTGAGHYYTKYSIAPNNVGIIHAYNAVNRTGEFIYTLPIFDVGEANMYINDGLREAFNIVFTANCYSNYKFDTSCRSLEGATVYKNNGERQLIATGQDPIYLEYVGGRRGGLTAESDGGYHSNGLIGDDWYGFTYDSYGMYGPISDPCSRQVFRYPYSDDRVVLVDGNVNDTTIHARALKFNPYALSGLPTGFNNTQIHYSISGITGVLNSPSSAKYIEFDLANYLPLKNTTGEEWYDSTGLVLGPFDRDTELCVKAPNKLFAYSHFYVNDEKLTSYYGGGTCEYNQFNGFSVNSGIIRGEGGRSEHITTFAIVPSGQTVRLNVYSSPMIGESGLSETKIGVVSPAIVTMTPRTTVENVQYIYGVHSGDPSIMNRLLYSHNGLEQEYHIPHTGGFGNLVGAHTFITAVKSGIIYPRPDTDFTGLARLDKFNNLIYDNSATPEQYWKNFARRNRVKVPITGWREATRVSFEFDSVELFYNDIPYQSYKVVIPSGNCIISGEMGYYGQADRTVFSEGVFLKNNTDNNPLQMMYAPSYVSDVLSRVPQFKQPSGNYVSGILIAPSVMKQRKTTTFEDNQTYDYLLKDSPDNYNKLFWPALSDLETLNPGETIEVIPPDDGDTFLNSTMLFSAARGQRLANGKNNPLINITFDVNDQFQMYDSIATDAMINSGICITSGRGGAVRLDYNLLSGVLTTQGKTIGMIYNELF